MRSMSEGEPCLTIGVKTFLWNLIIFYVYYYYKGRLRGHNKIMLLSLISTLLSINVSIIFFLNKVHFCFLPHAVAIYYGYVGIFGGYTHYTVLKLAFCSLYIIKQNLECFLCN